MSDHLTIPDIWETFLERALEDKPLRLNTHSELSAIQIKKALSTYKNRILSNDQELAELLGKFNMKYNIERIGKRIILDISMVRSRAKPRLDIEILPEEGE
jgi:hypothetical protein